MIVPAILTDKKSKFSDMLGVCVGFTDYVQIDIMDGKFVPSKSITAKDLDGLHSPIKSEAHLMVDDPLIWVDAFKQFGSKKIIFHFEVNKNHQRIIEAIRKENLEVGLGINPSTKLKDYTSLIADIDSVLFLSVNPGFYGSSFIPEVLEKIKEFKRNYPNKIAGIDGGIKLNNIKEVIKSGVNYICVGSAILQAQDPKSEYLKLGEFFNG